MKKIFLLAITFLFCFLSGVIMANAQTVTRWRSPIVDVYISKSFEDYKLMYDAFEAWCSASNRRFLFNLSSTKGMAKNGHVKVYFDEKDADSIEQITRSGLNWPEVHINIVTKDDDGNVYPKEILYPKMLHYAGLAIGLDESTNPKSALFKEPKEGQDILVEDVEKLYALYGWRLPKVLRYFR